MLFFLAVVLKMDRDCANSSASDQSAEALNHPQSNVEKYCHYTDHPLMQVRWRSLIMSNQNQNLLRSTPDYVVLHSFGRALTSAINSKC